MCFFWRISADFLLKTSDFCENVENLQVFAKIRKLARKLDRSIVGFSDFCENAEENVMLSFLVLDFFAKIRKSARTSYVQQLVDLETSEAL